MGVKFINFALLALICTDPGRAMDGTNAQNDSNNERTYNTNKGVAVQQFSIQEGDFRLLPEITRKINKKGIKLQKFLRCPTAAEVQQALDQYQDHDWKQISLTLANSSIQFTTTTSERGPIQFKGIYLDGNINCMYELPPSSSDVVFTASKNGEIFNSEKCHVINENYRVEGDEDPTGWASLYGMDTYIAEHPEDLGMLCQP